MRFFSKKPATAPLCPITQRPLLEVAKVLEDSEALLSLRLPYPVAALEAELKAAAEPLLKGRKLHLEGELARHGKPLGEIKNLVAVASGKGGVGKSTTTINLALALKALGLKVGVLDADLFGPSLPIMVGKKGEHPDSPDGKTMLPVKALGLYTQSIGYLVDAGDAAVWRGPMASTALMQLVNETHWPDIDLLLIDMPPGTGDIQLTVSQKLPLAGAVIVTTPQDLALSDAIKGMAMFDKVSVPILGLVENMSYHQCSQCGHKEHLFGDAGGAALAKEKGVTLLGQIPLTLAIRQSTDGGKPQVLAAPSSMEASHYDQAARRLLAELLKRPVVPAPIDIKMV
ncbi:iron-sulfur cluster carrier protein ApbC [Gallaecimonas kandeliae]|uniref:iron-sulfur cluster carrier protein ApbC n=1 Tax=Gallaecimonas kandeliae TaxID=3029055 RepID=UPI002647170D|nr:iron-sulfur cluster carrier protein ApbC [Gallaecimonas kandeliae]WKE67284.1 iron-sulfur cluster carrier protein ApbC [Gallaecimonas kandeliae]